MEAQDEMWCGNCRKPVNVTRADGWGYSVGRALLGPQCGCSCTVCGGSVKRIGREPWLLRTDTTYDRVLWGPVARGVTLLFRAWLVTLVALAGVAIVLVLIK